MIERESLAVVVPAYNEEAAISNVIQEWTKTLGSLGIDYSIHVYNDGSKDKTLSEIQAMAKNNPRVFAHDKKNSGHGPTILKGYRDNSGADWIFQMDSDNEMNSAGFDKLWQRRAEYDFLLGSRHGRQSPLPRQIISLISRLTVRLVFGKGVYDVNSPYRLMRSSAFRQFFLQIPDDTFAPNLIVSGYAASAKMRIYETNVPHQPRRTGEVSIKKWKLLKAASKALAQTLKFGIRFSGPKLKVSHSPISDATSSRSNS